MAKDGRALFSSSVCFGLALVFLIGCGPGEAPVAPTWATPAQPYVPQDGSSNAYDAYAMIARDVEARVTPSMLDRVFFDVEMKRKLMDKLDGPLGRLAAATHKRCEFRYVATPIFTPPPYQQGWRLLGRALTWKIELACVLGNYDGAIDAAVVATKFGFDLTGGGATDASLGFEIADEARRAIAPHLAKFGAGQLEALANGLASALDGKPAMAQVIDHEHERMLLAVQYVQDAALQGKLPDLLKNLKESVRDGVAWLRDLKPSKRAAYFQGFAAEADEQTRWLKTVAAMPANQRADAAGPRLAKRRPWSSFAKQFFTAAEPLLKIEDATVARTRLAILDCRIQAQVKTSGVAPPRLTGFPAALIVDPYTGRRFAYRASGPSFELYSVGADGIDNGGEADESFTAPDLKLEAK